VSNLPDGWADCLIGEVTKVVAGGTPPSKDPANFNSTESGIPWITPADLSGYKNVYISHGSRSLTEKGFASCSAVKMPRGSVLFSSRAPIGYVAIAANEITTNQGFKSFVLPEGLNSHFVYYYLRHIKPVAEAMATGTTFKELSGTTAAKLPLVVAPYAEQKRIADKLGSVLARVDTCRDRLDRVPGILKRLRKSIVSAASSGLLTNEWRLRNYGSADRVIMTTTLAEQCLQGRVITYGVIKLGNDVADGVPCLRTSNVRWLKVETDGIKKIAATLSNEYSRTILQGGEVLVNVRGTLGGVAVATTDMIGWNVSREVAVVPVDQSKVNPQFLALWVGAETSQRWLSGVEKGVAYTGINIADLRTLPIELPKLEEQTEIVRRVESLFAYADRLEDRYAFARAQVEKLTPALLAKAFRGDLVPQDGSDEPASVLLDRIRTTTLSKGKQIKARRKAPVKKISNESVRTIIRQMPQDRFSFEELSSQVTADYETLKDIVFALLSEPKPLLRQIFDEDAQAMRLEKAWR
jgi:type I restriction enzyme S subunit